MLRSSSNFYSRFCRELISPYIFCLQGAAVLACAEACAWLTSLAQMFKYQWNPVHSPVQSLLWCCAPAVPTSQHLQGNLTEPWGRNLLINGRDYFTTPKVDQHTRNNHNDSALPPTSMRGFVVCGQRNWWRFDIHILSQLNEDLYRYRSVNCFIVIVLTMRYIYNEVHESAGRYVSRDFSSSSAHRCWPAARQATMQLHPY